MQVTVREYGKVEFPDARKQWNANAIGWTELSRVGLDVYRDFVNTPAFFALLPPVDGLSCLDLGCGEGHNTRLLANAGAQVVGVDVADSFIEAAGAAGQGVRYVVGDGTALPFRASSFDVVTAFMSLMDIAEPETALREAARVLRPDGFVQFSVGHPTTSTPVRRWVGEEGGQCRALAISDYFYQGLLTETWTFKNVPDHLRNRHQSFTVTYARRTLSGWLTAVLAVGLIIEAVAEPYADEATAADHPEVSDTRVAPHVLIVRARKPSTVPTE